MFKAMTTKKTNPRKDFSQVAHSVFQQATGDAIAVESSKNKAAQELGRLGGLKGGAARAKALTPEQRSEIAKKAATKRWGK